MFQTLFLSTTPQRGRRHPNQLRLRRTAPHRNKKTGAVYVYSVESYWDKEKKAPRNKQVCLGRLDPETGEVMETLVRVKYSSRYGQVFTETTPLQRRIIEVFGIELPA